MARCLIVENPRRKTNKLVKDFVAGLQLTKSAIEAGLARVRAHVLAGDCGKASTRAPKQDKTCVLC